MKDKISRRTRRNIDLSPPVASVLPQVPVTYSTTQPLPGVTLGVKSVLRDILEKNLHVDVIKKLR